MRVVHHERQQMLIQEAERLSDRLELTPSDGGLHIVGWLANDRDDRTIAKRALRQGVHVWPLSMHYLRPGNRAALLLGYAGTTKEDMRYGVSVLDKVSK
jgi:GntR family transcriptional regulator/MocR family aminotransferase